MGKFNSVIANRLIISGLLCSAVGLIPESTHAKLDPFFILRNVEFTQFKPRVLFVLDTSGSMSFVPSTYGQTCRWNECEGDDPEKASRIHAARQAIRSIVTNTTDTANFSLMTFGQKTPPVSKSQVPTPCTACQGTMSSGGWVYKNGGWVYEYPSCSEPEVQQRFVWIESALNFTGPWFQTANAFGSRGNWAICGEKRPFPYIRHDEVFGSSGLPNNQTGELPSSPMHASESAYKDGSNRNRKVQWFSKPMGARINLACGAGNESNEAIIDQSHGDWGDDDNSATRRSNICGRDFYYWPYVDGFPGYTAYWRAVSPQPSVLHEYCPWNLNGGCKSDRDDDTFVAGVVGKDYSTAASLYAPFFSQATIDSGSVPADQKGPTSANDSADLIYALAAPMKHGGLDAVGGTPWASAIGNVDNHISNTGTPINGAIPMTNSANSHSTVASYLSFITTISPTDVCVPTSAVIITDGVPDPWSSSGSTPAEGGTRLFSRLRKLRSVLGVKTYVVGFGSGFNSGSSDYQKLQWMACSAAGSTDTSNPCSASNSAFQWDTCADPNGPTSAQTKPCAYVAEDPQALVDALTTIVTGALDFKVPTGPGSVVNEFNVNADGTASIVQTGVTASTDHPSWKGHVVREGCPEGDLECINVTGPNISVEEELYNSDGTLGDGTTGCGRSRSWDAGECLKNKLWNKRKLYSYDANLTLYRISDDNGNATSKFYSELSSQGLLDGSNPGDQANRIASFLLGKDLPDDWKIPGLGNSSPITIRRIPPPKPGVNPSVDIRDPHCAGRKLDGRSNVPQSLINFSEKAWEVTSSPTRYEFAEAVLIADDFGVLHGFHLDSGNEIFGLIPRDLLTHAADLSDRHAENMAANPPKKTFGQTDKIEDHEYGISATINTAVVFDPDKGDDGDWRMLATMGYGPAGNEMLALDVSHMGSVSGPPVDILWTTDQVSNSYKEKYDQQLGETWSRPAITYAVPGDSLEKEPRAFLVFASGYTNEPRTSENQGNSIIMVDALSGEQTWHSGFITPDDEDKIYGGVSNDVLVGDIAIGTHCLSRYWGEMQETYFASPSGKLYRWDLAAKENPPGSGNFEFEHIADSGKKWNDNGNKAVPAYHFKACQGTNEFACSIQSDGKGDVFTFGPAVVANDRIDESNDDGQIPSTPVGQRDQFMIALVSGDYENDVIDGFDSNNDFHSSIYLMVDNHLHTDDHHKGFTIPTDGAITPPATHPAFMRMALSNISRTRTWKFPDGSEGSNTRVFSKRTRPLRAPRIVVTGLVRVVDDSLPADDPKRYEVVPDVEVYYVTYTVYEPGEHTCDRRWYNEDEGEWAFDKGSTFEITIRLAVRGEDGFDFSANNIPEMNRDLGDGFGNSGAMLTVAKVVQVGDCDDGNCGAVIGASGNKPCSPKSSSTQFQGITSVSLGWTELDGFSPVEIDHP